MHATLASQNLLQRSRTPGPSQTNLVAKAIDRFTEACPEGDDRFTGIISNIQHFREASNAWMPSSWNKTRLSIDGMQAIDLEDVTTMKKVSALCKKQRLLSPSGFVKTNSFHYGKYCKNKLVSVLSISVMNLNKAPGSIAISVDIAASVDKKHSMSIAIDSLKKTIRRRRNKCVLFAQVAKTPSAEKFWNGKLTMTKRASLMTALFAECDDRYTIYADTKDMALFYD